jgi:hypothetical protein
VEEPPTDSSALPRANHFTRSSRAVRSLGALTQAAGLASLSPWALNCFVQPLEESQLERNRRWLASGVYRVLVVGNDIFFGLGLSKTIHTGIDRKMLLAIKQRAEAAAQAGAQRF